MFFGVDNNINSFFIIIFINKNSLTIFVLILFIPSKIIILLLKIRYQRITQFNGK